jgi:Na+/H+ antiporter NhaD/arsenite permease-like protein
MTAIIIIIFIIGYAAIAFEHSIRINKAATALVTGVLCWTVYILGAPDHNIVNEQLIHHLGELSQILFFLLGAMTIVELIDAHDGFDIITTRITTLKKSKLVWIISILAFFLSAILDNLTTTIVMVSLVRKLVADKKDRWMFAGLIIIAANAGGAWSPIGDVTTTMLWIGNQVTATNIMIKLIVPSLVCMLVPLLFTGFVFKGNIQRPALNNTETGFDNTKRERSIIFFSGVILLLLVPVFKTLTHLPPFMGILIALGIMWIITEMIHSGKDEAERKNYSVAYALRKIDTPSILFFLGILLSIAALQSTGQLTEVSGWMDRSIKDVNLVILSIGGLSAIVDNVPLVAAAQGMYSLETYPTDHYFWEFLAYATGTGGSMLIIGSAAGVAAMGIENISFGWYLKKIGWLAMIGYLAGAMVYILQFKFFGI